jgi:sugar phosphate isomerase/epimerase
LYGQALEKAAADSRERSKVRQPITRREALKTVTVLGSVFASGAVARASAPEPAPTGSATIGFCTLGFDDLTNQELADALAASGVFLVQLMLSQRDSRYWAYNSRSDISGLTPKRCKVIAQAYHSAKVRIRSLSVYTNLIHPDEAERKANLDYLEGMMKVAVAMGVDTVVTEAGHYNASGPDPKVEYYMQEDVWHRMIATGKQVAELAERHHKTRAALPRRNRFASNSRAA